MRWFADIIVTAGNALGLRPDTLHTPGFLNHSWLVALGIGILAGLSTFLGQLVVMAVNQIRGMRLAFTSLAAIVTFLVEYTIQAIVLWALSMLILDPVPGLTLLIQVMLVSAAPRVLNFLIAIPYSGPFFGAVTSVWSLLVLWMLMARTFTTHIWLAFALTVASGIALHLSAQLLSRPLGWLRDRIWRAVTGKPLLLTALDIQDRYVLTEDQWRRMLYGNDANQTSGGMR